MDVVIAALELRVLFDRNENVQIARRSAVVARFSFGRHPQTRALIDAGRNLDRQRFFFADAARSVARGARVLDDFSSAAALRTRSRDGKESLRIADLSTAAATAAWHGLRSGFRAAAAARGACDDAGNLQLNLL